MGRRRDGWTDLGFDSDEVDLFEEKKQLIEGERDQLRARVSRWATRRMQTELRG